MTTKPDYSNWQPAAGETPSADQSPIIPGRPSQPAPLPTVPEYGSNTVSLIPSAMQQRPELLYKDVPSTPVMPVAPSGQAAINAASKSQIIVENESGGSGVLLQTNGITNPNQKVLNLTGSGVGPAQASGNVPIASGGGGDGLVHGDSIWAVDSGYFTLRDDFVQGTTSSGTIGQLNWLMPSAGSAIQQFTGTPPNFGVIGIPTSGSSNVYNRLTIGSSSQNVPYQTSWDLLNNPGWKCVWVWKFDQYEAALSSGPAFSMAKKSFYIGLGMLYQSEATPRPHIFCGVRYDTDTTSPSIGDTEMQFEVVENPLTSTRNNTQGTVVSTGLTPTAGTWYRLEIECVAAGVITMSINGSTPQSFTFSSISIVGTSSSNISAGSGGASLTLSNSSWSMIPWAVGTQVTISGLTGGNASLNGTTAVKYAAGGLTLGIASSATIGSNDEAFTAAGYPSLSPWFTWGTDTEASPTANSAECYLDFFAFVWNAGIGQSATPNPTLSRYFA